MSEGRSVVVLGGGLSGMGAAYALARAGEVVTVVERGPELGGLAGTLRVDGHFYPLAYHHILHRDRVLLFFLDLVGALPRVRWRKIRMRFRVDGELFDLSHPLDFLRFPMSIVDKLRFTRMMLRAFRKSDWSDWEQRSADQLVDRWAGPGVREALFEPLSRLKFDRTCAEVSAAWLGARLHFREGTAPLGYIPDTNWTRELCEGLTRQLEKVGVRLMPGTEVAGLEQADGRVSAVRLADGATLPTDLVLSTLPTEVYRQIAPADTTPQIAAIRYTAIVSAICATRQPIAPEFYWMNLASPVCHASGLFRLDSLNPTIGASDDACLNFVTHVPSRDHEFFQRSDERLWDGYREDFRGIFGFELEPQWTRLVRLPMYSPVFLPDYENPPVRSGSFRNLYFAGNYRTFPSIASTGTALGSGLEAAAEMLAQRGGSGSLHAEALRFPEGGR